MQSLKATTAREITKESVTEAETLVVNGRQVSQSPQTMQAGDFYFRPTLVAHFTQPSWFRRVVMWKSAQTKYETVDTIVISCPACGLPILTNPIHKVTNRRPLTIEGTISCPYSPSEPHSFSIKDGNIMPA